MQHLQGHHCVVGGIPGPVHRALAPRGYLLQYLVPAYGLLLQFSQTPSSTSRRSALAGSTGNIELEVSHLPALTGPF